MVEGERQSRNFQPGYKKFQKIIAVQIYMEKLDYDDEEVDETVAAGCSELWWDNSRKVLPANFLDSLLPINCLKEAC